MDIFKDERLKKVIAIIKDTIKLTAFENHVFLVGGCIRNSILNLPINDIDIAVDTKRGGMVFATYFTARHKCFKVKSNPVIFDNYGTAKFQLLNNEELKDLKIECVETRKDRNTFGTIQEDAKRRDLTINSLYYDISNDKLYDYNGKGIYDLYNRTIRTPSNPDVIFGDDPLRILRAIRYSTQLGWGINAETWLGIIKNATKLSSVSQERISDEISKILLCEKPSIGIRKMYYSGVLRVVLPDIYDSTMAYESKNPFVTTFDHTMNVLDETQPYLDCRLAALFHDVARVVSQTVRGISLDCFSSEVAAADLKMMKFPNHVIKSVETAIKYHRFFKEYADGVLPSDKKIRKFVNICGNDIGTVVDLMNANNTHVTHDKKKRQVLDIVNRIEELEKIENSKKVKLPINGNDIITEFKLKPSPKISILLDEVKEAYFENPNITKDECFEIVESKLKTL